jgi:ectoine hydroxylase
MHSPGIRRKQSTAARRLRYAEPSGCNPALDVRPGGKSAAMRLSDDLLTRFSETGLLVLPNLFSDAEVELLRAALEPLLAQDDPANIREKGGGAVRTAMGLHLRSPVFAKLVRHPRLIEPALQILGRDLYVQQVKVNIKEAFEGEAWQWHYDFATHSQEDGVPAPLALNLHVFLDDVSEFNGPLYFIPGSHRKGPAPATLDTHSTSYPLWVVDRDTVTQLASRNGLISGTGPKGTVLIFGDVMVHASPPNLSPWSRRIFSLIVNPTDNRQTRFQRPEHKHHRDFSPIVPLADDCLSRELTRVPVEAD